MTTLQKLCRICNQKESEGEDDFIDMFSDLAIPVDVYFITGIIITGLSSLPQPLICLSCHAQVKTFAQFKRKALKMDENFRQKHSETEYEFWSNEHASFYNDEPEDTFEEQPFYIKEEPVFVSESLDSSSCVRFLNENNFEGAVTEGRESESDDVDQRIKPKRKKSKTQKRERKTIYCEKCDRTISQRGYQLHMKVTHNELNQVFICKYCDQIFKCEAYLARHVKSLHKKPYQKAVDAKIKIIRNQQNESSKADTKPENIQIDENPGSKQCSICKKTFTTVRSCKNHMKIAHVKSKRIFKCKHCPKKAKIREYMMRHLKSMHSMIIGSDNKGFSTTEESDEAYEEIDSELVERVKPPKLQNQPKFCEICQKSFSCKRTCLEHMKTKHGTDRTEFRCPECGQSFALLSYLKRHTKTKHGFHTKDANAVVIVRDERGERVRKSVKREDVSSDDTIDDMMEFITMQH